MGLILVTPSAQLLAGGKIGVYGIRMVPYGSQAEKVSRQGWGGGFHAVVPFKQVSNLFAFTGGFEIVNFLNETLVFQDPRTQLRIEQRTNQDFFRFYLGGQVGGHGNGFVRPHVGMNLALNLHTISTENVIPDDNDPEKDIHQKLQDDTKAVFGYDFTLGCDLNFSNTIVLDGGVRYIKSFAVPEQLEGRSEKIYPQYFQIYLGVGMAFEWMKKLSKKGDQP